jgi:predicted RNase H-like nuclease
MMNYYDLDDETANDLLNKAVEIEQERLNIRREYISKMLEKLPPQVVGKFFQLDARIFALIDLVRMSSIPLVRSEE